MKPMTKDEAMKVLVEIGERIRTQDLRPDGSTTHATANPLYMVQQRRETYGIDIGYQDPDGYSEDDDGEKWPYVETWEFVQGAAFLTRKGAESFIEINGHNLDQPRIYVASAYRCYETIELRAALVALAENCQEEAR